MVRKTRRTYVDGLSLQLIVAVSGVTAGLAACAGRSESSGSNDDGGTSGSSGKGGSSAKGGTGGGTAKGGTGQSGGSIGGGSGGTGQGGSGNAGPQGCVEPDDQPPGVHYCKGSFTHHPAGTVCPAPPHAMAATDGAAGAAGATGEAGAAGAPVGPPVNGACSSDADCTAEDHGYCIEENDGPGTFRYCLYACEADGACASNELCSCESGYRSALNGEDLTFGVCKPASCHDDDQCGEGLLCISPVDAECGTPHAGAYDCQTAADECAGPGDCPDTKHECAFTIDHWKCVSPPICGRPFLVEGALRQSDAEACTGWLDATLAAEPLPALTPEEREAVKEHWVRSGLMEHGSVAAFARFALQLLALGAPAELVEAATRAMADEARHAKTCFGLASRFAGETLGPGPLDVAGALGPIELMDVVDLVIEEGCIGETGAALEAAWAADAATDPVVREALAGIAEDEARHSELAWRFVAWAATRDARVAGRVEAQVATALARMAALPAPLRGANARELAAHGVLDEGTRREARIAALRDVLPGVVARLAA